MGLKRVFFIAAAFVLIGSGCSVAPAPNIEADTGAASPAPSEQTDTLPPADDKMEKEGGAMEQPMEEPGSEKSSDADKMDAEVMEGGGGAALIIGYYDDGFREEEVPNFTMDVGTTIDFHNFSSRPFWPASNVHPAHNILPEFDSRGPVAPGESYRYTFDKAGTWPFHDHLRASLGGVIIVTE